MLQSKLTLTAHMVRNRQMEKLLFFFYLRDNKSRIKKKNTQISINFNFFLQIQNKQKKTQKERGNKSPTKNRKEQRSIIYLSKYLSSDDVSLQEPEFNFKNKDLVKFSY